MRATLGAFLFALAFAPIAEAGRRPIPPANPNLVEVPVASYRAGLTLGAAAPTDSSFGGSRVLLGADFYVVREGSFDFGFSYLTGETRVEATRKRWRMNDVGGELNYKCPGTAPGLYVGAAAGIASFDGGDAFLPGFDHFFLGPKLGLLRMISRSFSVGVEGRALLVTSDPLLLAVEALGSLRYHF